MKDVSAKISMTSFLDFTLMPDSQKVRKVRDIKYNDYNPGTDYWKPLRDSIKKYFQKGQNFSILEDILEDIDPKKLKNYRNGITGFKKFLKKYDVEFFDPESRYWVQNDFAVNVNPELGLYVNGVPHLVKLYFKEETTTAEIILNKSRGATIAYLMDLRLKEFYNENTRMSILNVKKGELNTPDIDPVDQEIALDSSVAHFMRIWNRL